MIIGIGTDIAETERIKKALANERFRARVYSPAEREYCEGRGAHTMASYAARWAAKEAIGKALGCGITGGELSELEILPGENGKPYVRLGKGWAAMLPAGAKIHISLSHAKLYATAQCVIETEQAGVLRVPGASDVQGD